LFASAVCVGTGLLVGIGPALQASKVNVLQALGSGISAAKHVRSRLRYGIVVPQVALSLVLLLVASVHLHSLSTIELKDLGYRTDNTVVLTFNRWTPQPARLLRKTEDEQRQRDEKVAEEVRAFNRSVLERVQRVPGVGPFAITTSLPLGSRPPTSLSPLIEYEAELNGEPSKVSADRMMVSDGYFQAMGMRVLRGRSFDERDRLYGQKVTVISDRLSRKLFPFGDPIGRKLSFVPADSQGKLDWLEIIGVVNDVDPVLGSSSDHPVMYESLLQQWRGWAITLVVSSASGDPTKLVPDLKKA
jgi:putative ABC transport system permease protein